jgi:hypothetical protein
VAAHLATKLAALVDRPDSAPGDKDRHEIMALLGQNVAHVGHQQQFRSPGSVRPFVVRRSADEGVVQAVDDQGGHTLSTRISFASDPVASSAPSC